MSNWEKYFPEGNMPRTVRARNALLNGIDYVKLGVVTPQIIAQFTERELLKFPNFGKSSLVHIKVWLRANGYELRAEDPPAPKFNLAYSFGG